MRSLMAPTKPATAEVALFLSDFIQSKHTIWSFNEFVIQNVGAAPLPCEPQQTARVLEMSPFL